MDILCDSNFIVLPVSHHAKEKRLYFYMNDILVYDLVAAIDPYEPDYQFYLNVERFHGKKIRLVTEPQMEFVVEKTDHGVSDEEAYIGKYRPRVHFTAKRGWLNDPNGLVFYKGQYLMFFQHNPVGCKWENMHWGYAVSKDLMHWKEQDIALYPDREGTMFSGCAFIDKQNVTGLKTNENDVLLLFYTSAGSTSETAASKPFTQCLAYSTDCGRTFMKYDKNPLISQSAPGNRDPKVFYHEQTDRYIMVLYLDQEKFAFYSSKNLLDWKMEQEIAVPGEIECPDFYPLPVDDDPKNIKWVFIGASDKYYIGNFDGSTFCPDHKEPLQLKQGNGSYAAQSWSNISDGRRIRMSCYSMTIPGMPFGGCMSVPEEMKLKTFDGQLRLCISPVQEIQNLYHQEVLNCPQLVLDLEHSYEYRLPGMCYDFSFCIYPEKQTVFSWNLFGLDFKYDVETSTVSCMECSAQAKLYNGRLDVRMIVDTVCAEIFINSGSIFLGMVYIQDRGLDYLCMKAVGGSITVTGLRAIELQPFWEEL